MTRNYKCLSQALQMYGFGRGTSTVHPRLLRRTPHAPFARTVPCNSISTSSYRSMLGSGPMRSDSGPTRSAGGEASKTIIFAANQPADLPNRVADLSAWSVSSSKKGLVRLFVFPTFSAAWRFMSLVAEECKTKRHHPSWHNLYNKVTVEWTTHKPEGLSIKDVEMAEFCDKIADNIGLQVQDHNTGTAGLESPSTRSH
ncbi:transcriptional coactivator/pterin dehydratase [Melanomma pulvis-pyrius CBS 109.77]|uniref:4a-hydroxytetrahydrobiopterin dehydratase n=1 Tax=Melanomma pulvis-pyrius CBS 109.77 TaxID=1314802 RepID=A0A6A6WUI4_9PLEO|nr:transcriptional coactivator/pterin dehydratase [Melanomma pulvis-pyrius CBS 109.77]